MPTAHRSLTFRQWLAAVAVGMMVFGAGMLAGDTDQRSVPPEARTIEPASPEQNLQRDWERHADELPRYEMPQTDPTVIPDPRFEDDLRQALRNN